MLRKNTGSLQKHDRANYHKSKLLFRPFRYVLSPVESVQKRVTHWISPHVNHYKFLLWFQNTSQCQCTYNWTTFYRYRSFLLGILEWNHWNCLLTERFRVRVCFRYGDPTNTTRGQLLRLANTIGVRIRGSDGVRKKLLGILKSNIKASTNWINETGAQRAIFQQLPKTVDKLKESSRPNAPVDTQRTTKAQLISLLQKSAAFSITFYCANVCASKINFS